METKRADWPVRDSDQPEDWNELPPALKIDVATGNQLGGRRPEEAGQLEEAGTHDPGNAAAQIRQRHGNGPRRASTPPPTRRNPLNHYY